MARYHIENDTPVVCSASRPCSLEAEGVTVMHYPNKAAAVAALTEQPQPVMLPTKADKVVAPTREDDEIDKVMAAHHRSMSRNGKILLAAGVDSSKADAFDEKFVRSLLFNGVEPVINEYSVDDDDEAWGNDIEDDYTGDVRLDVTSLVNAVFNRLTDGSVGYHSNEAGAARAVIKKVMDDQLLTDENSYDVRINSRNQPELVCAYNYTEIGKALNDMISETGN